MNNLEKQAKDGPDFVGSLMSLPNKFVGGLQYATGLSGETLKWAVPAAGVTMVGGPVMMGYLLGKARRRLKDFGADDSDSLERELLKKKYDETIAAIAEKKKLFPEKLDG